MSSQQWCTLWSMVKVFASKSNSGSCMKCESEKNLFNIYEKFSSNSCLLTAITLNKLQLIINNVMTRIVALLLIKQPYYISHD
jgi:hypothetical protein